MIHHPALDAMHELVRTRGEAISRADLREIEIRDVEDAG